MKKIVISVYAACAMLVIAGSLLWFVFTLHSDVAAGKTAALNNFKVFAKHTGEIVSESAQEPDSARLQPQFEQLCRNYQKYVQAVVIKDPTGIVFTWPKDTDIFSYTEQSTVEVCRFFLPRLKYISRLKKPAIRLPFMRRSERSLSKRSLTEAG